MKGGARWPGLAREGLGGLGCGASAVLLDEARPSAFAFASDTLAVGVLHTLAERGQAVGRDIAVVGCGALEGCSANPQRPPRHPARPDTHGARHEPSSLDSTATATPAFAAFNRDARRRREAWVFTTTPTDRLRSDVSCVARSFGIAGDDAPEVGVPELGRTCPTSTSRVGRSRRGRGGAFWGNA